MTVKEVREYLEQFPQDATVAIYDSLDTYEDGIDIAIVTSISLEDNVVWLTNKYKSNIE